MKARCAHGVRWFARCSSCEPVEEPPQSVADRTWLRRLGLHPDSWFLLRKNGEVVAAINKSVSFE